MNKRYKLFIALVLLSQFCFADQDLIAARVDQLPVIDGIADDTVWQQATPILTFDAIADAEIELRAVYTEDSIAFLAQYADTTESREHKPLHWDPIIQFYKPGAKREDALIFKWNMDPLATNITLQSNQPYKADIWYWKAFRSDHAGYADDKYQIYSGFKLGKKNKILLSTNGATFYFRRHGDEGKSAYKSLSPTENSGDKIEGYSLSPPKGSRADVQAKGVWLNNRWSIEFSRKLDTGHDDDVQFTPENSYLFGVSRYEIAARKSDPNIDPPNYGAGEISEHLQLKFTP